MQRLGRAGAPPPLPFLEVGGGGRERVRWGHGVGSLSTPWVGGQGRAAPCRDGHGRAGTTDDPAQKENSQAPFSLLPCTPIPMRCTFISGTSAIR